MFVVLAEPIASVKIGRAYIGGVCLAKVNVTDAGHAYATITDGEEAYLTSAASGPVQILWKEAGTGQKWAQIRLGTPATGTGVPNVYRRVSDNGTAGRYDCRLQKWESAAWSDFDSVTVVCDVTIETSGHAFTSTPLPSPPFFSIIPIAHYLLGIFGTEERLEPCHLSPNNHF